MTPTCSAKHPAPCTDDAEFLRLADSAWLCAGHAPHLAEENDAFRHIDALWRCVKCRQWFQDDEKSRSCWRSWCTAKLCAACSSEVDECPECGIEYRRSEEGISFEEVL